jgi:predicted nucleotidyltransferase
MLRHQAILPHLVEVCASIHDRCGVVLIGSVTRGAERPDSDIDLNLIFPGDECPLGRHPYVDHDNRWQLVHKGDVDGLRVDVAWETEHALLKRLQSDDVLHCWPFSRGRVPS